MKGFRYILIVVVFSLKAVVSYAQDTDYKMASLYLYNFAKYVDWPDSARKSQFIIGVFGSDEIKAQLIKTIGSKTMNGTPIIVRQIRHPEEAVGVNMLFISYPESAKLSQISALAGNRPILIVSEKQGLLRKGAGINLFVDEEDSYKTKFEINKKSIEGRNLKVASSLVKLAEN